MRWVAAQPGPSWSVHDVHVGWVEALRGLGEDVHEFNLDDRLALYANALVEVDGDQRDGPSPEGYVNVRRALSGEQAEQLAVNGLAAQLWKVRPQILLVTSGFFAPAEMLDHARRAYGTTVVIIHTEEPYEVERELALAQHADLNLINDPTHLARFQAIAPTVYAPHAYRPTVHHSGPGLPRLAADLAFVGTGFGSRRWFFEELHRLGHLDGLDVLLAGNWRGVEADSPLSAYIAADHPGECLDNADASDVYRSARAGINLYRREADQGQDAAGWAMGPREIEMAACGMFFARDPRPEGDEVFPMLPTFGNPGEAGEVLTWWLAQDARREKAAGAAREAIADRTFTQSATNLLRLFDRQPSTV